MCPEDLPILRPFLLEAWWHHDDDRPIIGPRQCDRGRHGQTDKRLAHADLIREDDTWLLLQSGQERLCRARLTSGVFIRYAIGVKGDRFSGEGNVECHGSVSLSTCDR